MSPTTYAQIGFAKLRRFLMEAPDKALYRIAPLGEKQALDVLV